jgi:hypothetical protein
MAGIDKNKAVLTFLSDCPVIKDNPLYFNFAEARDNESQYLTMSNDVYTNRNYVDGSKLKQFTFTLITFKSMSPNEIIQDSTTSNENVDDMFDLQDIIDWVNEQNELYNYPDFGDKIEIDKMETTTDMPTFDGVDTSVSPALAMYSIAIRIDYIDYSKTVWS